MASARQFVIASAAFPLLALFAGPSQAGLLEDNDKFAREQIQLTQKDLADFRAQTTTRFERLEAAMRMQVELANQIEALRAELAKLRGQVEVNQYEIETGNKRQRDFYVDLDSRIRKLETMAAELVTKINAPPPAPLAPVVDPAMETRRYEDALNLFKDAKYKEAQESFVSFLKDYPSSSLAPSALFWRANTHYAQRDCKTAMEVHGDVVLRFPESAKAPDALLAIATCQQESNDAKNARKTLEALVGRYPNTPAAETAKQRLKRK